MNRPQFIARLQTLYLLLSYIAGGMIIFKGSLTVPELFDEGNAYIIGTQSLCGEMVGRGADDTCHFLSSPCVSSELAELTWQHEECIVEPFSASEAFLGLFYLAAALPLIARYNIIDKEGTLVKFDESYMPQKDLFDAAMFRLARLLYTPDVSGDEHSRMEYCGQKIWQLLKKLVRKLVRSAFLWGGLRAIQASTAFWNDELSQSNCKLKGFISESPMINEN